MTTVKELRAFLKHWKNDIEVGGNIWLVLDCDPIDKSITFAELDVPSMDCVIFDDVAELCSVRGRKS